MEVGPKNEKPTSPKKERVLKAGKETWDLRTPPSRKEAGMPPGETVVIYERGGWWRTFPIRARVLLPEAKRVEAEVGYVAFDSYGAPCPQSTGTSDPTTMDISVDSVSLDEAHRILLGAADEFGFAHRYIEEWYSEAKRADGIEQATERVDTPFLRSKVGYLTLDVQGRFSPIGDEPDNTFVHYTFSWSEPRGSSACKKPEETTASSETK